MSTETNIGYLKADRSTVRSDT